MRILGIDPGLLNCGYIVLEGRSRDLQILAGGVLSSPPNLALGSRLWHLYKGIEKILEEYRPQIVAVEEPLPKVNPLTTAKVIKVFALVLLASEERGLPSVTYHPSYWRSFLCGDGQVKKENLLKVVRGLLVNGFDEQMVKGEHTLDALGIALVCALERGAKGVL